MPTIAPIHSSKRCGRRGSVALASLAFAVSLFAGIPARAQDIGTLFTSPEEREYMDYLRQDFVIRSQMATFNIEEDVIPDIPPESQQVVAEAPPVVQEYKFGGIMMRLNGSRMVWLNGSQIAESDLPGNMRLVDSASGTLLSITVDNRNFLLKPGQAMSTSAGTVQESFQQSASTPVPAAPAAVAPAPAPGAGGDGAASAPAPEQETTMVASSEDDPSDLAAVMERLNLDEENISDDQRQQILDILTEQASTTE